jgi:hypothetical protein
MTRWKASAIHLALSVIVLCTIAAVLVWRWYPPGLFHMAQADKLLVLIGGVDVVLGPLLTLIVFKQGKKSLRFDLTVIALMQLAALCFGLHTAWQSRPVYLVAAVDRFNLVFANEIDREDLRQAAPSYRDLPALGPHLVGITVPTDPRLKERALMDALAGKDLPDLPSHYLPYPSVAGSMLSHATPVAEYLARLPASDRRILRAAIASTGHSARQLAIVPIQSSRGDATMLLLSSDGTPLRPVAVSAPQGQVSPRAPSEN